jgi:hypothetical protein
MSNELFEHMMNVSPQIDKAMLEKAKKNRLIHLIEMATTDPNPPTAIPGSQYISNHRDEVMQYNSQDKANLSEEDKQAIRDMTWESIALKMYGLLDDIDTASDMCKEDAKAFENVVMNIQAKKNEYLYSPDGYGIQRVSECVCHTYAMDDDHLLEFFVGMRKKYENHGAQYRWDRHEVYDQLVKRGLTSSEQSSAGAQAQLESAEGLEAPESEDPNKKFKDFVKHSSKVEKGAKKKQDKQAKKDKKKRECRTIKEGLQDHARKELELAGLFDKNSDYDGMIGEAVMDLVDAFCKAGHSGFSAQWAKQVFCDLAEWKNLTPLTNDPEEWQDVREYCADSEEMYQNRRNPSCFSKDGGKTYYSLEEVEKLKEDEDTPWQDRVEWHTSVDMKSDTQKDNKKFSKMLGPGKVSEGESDFKDLEVNRRAEKKAKKKNEAAEGGWSIWSTTTGGAMGSQGAWQKKDGKPVRFASEAKADKKAEQMNDDRSMFGAARQYHFAKRFDDED